MSFQKKLKELLTGLSIPQEYICLDLAKYQFPFAVRLTTTDKTLTIDVTHTNLFLGYKPLIIGLPFSKGTKEFEKLKLEKLIRLTFHSATSANQVAFLELEKIQEKILGDHAVFFFKGVVGHHAFLNPINQFINVSRERWRKTASTNVSLDGNLYDQVRIAYAVPRIISVITVSDGDLMNMFPTDLHGPVGERFYVSSLRVGGRANEQVEKYKRVVISEVEASFFQNTYELGKNHMRELRSRAAFFVTPQSSETFGFPLPATVTHYRELQQMSSFDYGIHRIHQYEVLHHKTVSQSKSKLVHMHQYPVQWRQDHKLQTEMLLR